MGATLSTLADEEDRKSIEGAIKQILLLEDEHIKKNTWFKRLKELDYLAHTQEKSILEFLTDDDLLEIIEVFKGIQSAVSKNIEALEKDGGELSRLKEESATLENKISAKKQTILGKQANLRELLPPPPEPGYWANLWTNFVASIGDMKPGPGKRFLLLFVSEKDIHAAQIIRNYHTEPARARQELNETIASLESEKAGLEKNLSSVKADIGQKEGNLRELKEQQQTLEDNVPILVESAKSLISTEKQQQAEKDMAIDRELDFDIPRQPFGYE
ncbi:hypothetical protein Lste_2310 [Legionella steelei]|uniref:Coiled coil protein n=1 Tax=Legionella steelei TaxID=947033 RepID=A0A0W0ZJI0_9GAMM|nr:hypothetical protein [Legionella steelei]KTD69152.1 hypothetical protein Lste_2310 [Legionella steelei]